MNIQYYGEFVALAETKNFQEAADSLYISQPSLSKHIKRMEEELGFTLLDRSAKKVELTDNGRHFLPYALEISMIHRRCVADFSQVSTPVKQNILVGVCSYDALEDVANLIPRFKQENPGFGIQIMHTSVNQLKEMLRHDRCHLVFVLERTGKPDLEFERISSSVSIPVVAALPSHHPLTRCSRIKVADLAHETFIQLYEAAYGHDLSLQLCYEAGFTPNVQYTVNKSEIVMELVGRGFGVALSSNKRSYTNAHNVELRTLDPEEFISNVLLFRKDVTLSPEEQWILDYFRRVWGRRSAGWGL